VLHTSVIAIRHLNDDVTAVLEITQFERSSVGYAAIVKALGSLVPAELIQANTKTSVVTQAKIKTTAN
jgi:hypothetical protein